MDKRTYLFLLFILSGSALATEVLPNTCNYQVNNSEKVYCISMVELLANPEKYSGKLVSVVGFVSFEFEGTAIYLHKEDYENMLIRNSYWLSLGSSSIPKFNLRYANVEGRFIYKKGGHLDLWQGFFTEIKSITRTINKADIRKTRKSK